MKPFVLPDNIYSPDQLSMVILDLNTYQGDLRDQAARAKSKTKKQTPSVEPTALLQFILDAAGIDHADPDTLDELRKHLEEMLSMIENVLSVGNPVTLP